MTIEEGQSVGTCFHVASWNVLGTWMPGMWVGGWVGWQGWAGGACKRGRLGEAG
jgi:hypothetical protein